jgi:hypothetical protein
VSLATVQYQVMGLRGSLPPTPGEISSLRDPLTEQIRVPRCSCMSCAAWGSFCHVAARPWGDLRSCGAEPPIEVNGAVD